MKNAFSISQMNIALEHKWSHWDIWHRTVHLRLSVPYPHKIWFEEVLLLYFEGSFLLLSYEILSVADISRQNCPPRK